MGKMKGKKGTDGAPTKLTQELITKLCNAIRGGVYAETAAQLCGVHKATFYVWLKKGSGTQSGLCKVLNDAVCKALAESEARDVFVIDKAGQLGDWRASAWRLERKFSKRWGRTEKLEVTGTEGGPVKYENVTEAELDRRFEEHVKAWKSSIPEDGEL